MTIQDQLFQRMRDEGEVLGLEKGELIGLEKGKLNTLRFTLKEQLKVKLGTLSSPLEERLTETSLEKLNELTLNIFNINSEEDVLKISCYFIKPLFLSDVYLTVFCFNNITVFLIKGYPISFYM